MAAADTCATLTFGIPDNSIPPGKRGFFSFTSRTDFETRHVRLHNYRTSQDIVPGPEGLDVQGFVSVKHRFSLDSDELMKGENVENVYLPEVAEFVREFTGASKAAATGAVIRGQILDAKHDLHERLQIGQEGDKKFNEASREKPLVIGRAGDDKVGPVSSGHIDWSLKGLRSTVRHFRPDVQEMAATVIRAEEENRDAPRYAAYSVWRPLETVERDPLVCCDSRTFDAAREAAEVDYRAFSQLPQKEYLNTGYIIRPPPPDTKQKWYWMPKQEPDEVTVLKLADTGSEKDPTISGGVPHNAAVLDQVNITKPRRSIEVRVIVFW